MEKLSAFFAGKPIHSILDVGTGSGQFIEILLKAFPHYKNIIGIDPGQDCLQKAQEKYPIGNIKFQQMGAENIQFPDQSFDVVTMSKALHHLPHIEASFKEFKRVLKPQGWLVIGEMFSDNLSEAEENQKMWHHIKSKIDRLLGNYHHKTWKKNELLKIISTNGFDVVQHFDHFMPENKIQSEKDIEIWVSKMESEVARLEGMDEYKGFLPLITQFKERIQKYGLQSPTNLIAICQVKAS